MVRATHLNDLLVVTDYTCIVRLFHRPMHTANILTAQVGYGNCAGFLFNKGIMAPPPPASNTDANVPEDPDINPITGSKFKPSGPDPMDGMTDEEKEREAEKLFVLFDRLEKMGMAVNPVRKAQEEGRFEEMP